MNFLSLMLQDLSKIILIWLFCAQETFLIIINVENCISVETDHFFQDSSMNRNVR